MLFLFIYQLLDSYTESLKCDACARIAGIWQIQRVLKNAPITAKSFWVQIRIQYQRPQYMIPSLLVVGTPILIADELKSNREFLKESPLSKKERVSKNYCALRSGEADLTSLRSPYSTLGTRFRQQPYFAHSNRCRATWDDLG